MPDLDSSYRGAVLVVPEHPWPSTSGARVRTAGIANALADLGPLTVLALDSTGGEPAWLDGVQRHRRRRSSPLIRGRDVARGLALGRHIVLERAERAGLADALGVVLRDRRPSVVVLGRPILGRFVDEARAVGAAVIADVDESQRKVSRSVLRSSAPLAKRGRAFLDLLSAARMERTEFPRVDQIWVSGSHELAAVRPDAGVVPLAIVPNGSVFPEQQPPSPASIAAVGFVGYFGHPPNEAAALELISSVMPAVRAAGGPQQLRLIGREPSLRMYRAAKGDSDITITGHVDDPMSALRSAGVLVMPIRSGGGTRIKAVEAAAAGVPIVSTSYGLEGLPFIPNVHALIADTPEEFGAAVQAVRDPDTRARLVRSAFERANQSHSDQAQRAAVRAAVRQVLSPTNSAASPETTASGR